MAKISALTDGTPPQGTDVLPVARSGANRKLSAGSFPIVLARWGVPCILASSGSMANNGAVSAMTALPTTYSGGAWLYLPAGAVAAGVPASASFLWFVASSTTAGTVYNSTWDGAGIPPLGTTTAFATTGPGAFTGVAAGEITAATVTVPAGAMGPNGELFASIKNANNTAAGNKIVRAKLGATTHMTLTHSTSAASYALLTVSNGGVASAQKSGFVAGQGVNDVSSNGLTYGTVDTSASTTFVLTLEKATATNHVILESATVTLAYGA